jgi:uncharacterized membrane protein
MMYWGSGWGTAGGLAMTIGMIVVATVAVAGLFLLIRPVFGHSYSPAYAPETDSVTRDKGELEALSRRYAQGEIAREEYLERRRDLVEPSSGA